jgi:adenosine deaminase
MSAEVAARVLAGQRSRVHTGHRVVANVKAPAPAPKHGALASPLVRLISETNGVSLLDTLELAIHSMLFRERHEARQSLLDFRDLLFDHARDAVHVDTLLAHPVGQALRGFLRAFPMPYREEHIHLSGSLDASFVYPRLMQLLEGPRRDAYEEKLRAVYGDDCLPIRGEADVDRLIRLREDISFGRYLQVLTLPKLVLIDRDAHRDAAYHMASTLFREYNVGFVRLKFTFSRATSTEAEALPFPSVSAEDVVLGLYEGFESFRSEEPRFDYVLSPCVRKEAHFYDASRFASKRDDFLHQVRTLLDLIERHPFLEDRLTDIDTVGDERDHYRKVHFEELRLGFRKLQFRGFAIRSHHGETWRTLRRGVQAVDNAMNIWHIDTVEHGVSLGVNPNYYFHMIFERAMALNHRGQAVPRASREYDEITEMDWSDHPGVRDKLLRGVRLDADDLRRFIKVKFHLAREVEHYQHDVLNRMLHKGVSLVALPSSNIMLTHQFPTYKDHPFSWWEKKGIRLTVGTDNYVTLDTDFIREMLILLCTDMASLKITKLLMTVTGESRRPYLSRLLWSMRH